MEDGILRQAGLPSSTSCGWKTGRAKNRSKDKPDFSSCLSQRLQNQPKIMFVNVIKEVATKVRYSLCSLSNAYCTEPVLISCSGMVCGMVHNLSKWCASCVTQPVLPVHVHDRCCLLCQSTPSLCFSVDKAQQSFCQP